MNDRGFPRVLARSAREDTPKSQGYFARHPDALPWAYVVTAPLLWPAIFLGAVSLTRGGGDSCDRVYDGDWASRDAEFRAMQMMQVIGSGVMIAIGCALIAVLIARRRRISRIRLTLAIVATAVMILAYLGMIAVSGYSTDCLV